jgi:hypothetical protein
MSERRELYRSPNGDSWFLGREPTDGHAFIIHQPNAPSGGRLASVVSDLAVTRAGSWLLLSAAARAPELIRDIVRRTRLPSLSAITGQKGAEC